MQPIVSVVSLLILCLLAGCDPSKQGSSARPTGGKRGGAGKSSPGRTNPVAPASNGAIATLNKTAEILESVTDAASAARAKPRLAALKTSIQQARPVWVTACYLCGELPITDPRVKADLARAARTDPKFKPHLNQAEALVANPQFRPAFRRYRQALDRIRTVPGGENLAREYLVPQSVP